MTPPDRPDRRAFTPDFLTELFRNPLDPGYADAAARRAADRAAGRTPDPRATLGLRALTAGVLVVLGFLFVVAYRKTMADEPERTATRAALVEQVQRKRDATDALQLRADELRGTVADLREQELGASNIARLRNLEGATGLSRVRGDGVQITLDDGQPTVNPVNGKTDDGRVHDTELQQVANALWAAGAEAIAVNDQRLTATSTIRLAGDAILVDFRPVAAPYQVVALGPEELRDDFETSKYAEGLRRLAAELGMRFDTEDVEGVTLGAASAPKLRYATPAVPASPSPPPGSSPGSPLSSSPSPSGPSGSPSKGG